MKYVFLFFSFSLIFLSSCNQIPCVNGIYGGLEEKMYPSCKVEEDYTEELAALVFLSTNENQSNSGTMQWARLYGKSDHLYQGIDLVTDESDNIYSTGNYDFYGSSNSGSYVMKYDTNGNKIWDTSYYETNVNAIALDSQKDIYIVGHASSTLDGNSCYNLASRKCLFLIKYDNDGSLQWTKTFYGKNYSNKASTEGRNIVIDSNDNLYVVGETNGYIDGYSNPEDNEGVLLLKYDTSGSKEWGKLLIPENPSGEVYSYVSVNSMVLDGDDNIYIGGYTEGHLDGQQLSGSIDTFIIKYNSNGDIQWTKLIGSSGFETLGADLVLDSQNNLYVLGSYKTSSYGVGFMGEDCYIVLSGGKIPQSSCNYIIKYDSNMNQKWIKLLAPSNNIGVNGMAIDKYDNIYLAGSTQYSIDDYESLDEVSAFFMKYDSNGKRQWYQMLSAENANTGGYGITISNNNMLYATYNTGYDINQIYSNTLPTIDFYGQSLTGLRDAYVVKYK